NNLSRSALQTVLLVFLVLWIGLGIRESVIAGISIPFAFLIAFTLIIYSGYTINFVSLFALILSIGMLVDSAIVIVEGIAKYRKQGFSPNDAIRGTLKEFATPVVSGTLTTLVVFIPMMFLPGITGQFIKSIPVTILFVLS